MVFFKSLEEFTKKFQEVLERKNIKLIELPKKPIIKKFE